MRSRRDLLGSVGGAATVGLAGCAGLPTFDGAGGTDHRPFTDWLYDPSSISTDHYPTVVVNPAAVASVRQLVPTPTYGAWRTPVVASDPANLGMDRIDSHVRFDGGTIAAMGAFSVGELVTGLEQGGYTERSEHRGYQVFLRSLSADDRIHWEAVGAANGAYVACRRRNRYSATLRIEQAIDAAEGRTPRYDIESSAFGTLVDYLGDATVVAAETYEPLGRPRVVPAHVDGTVGVGHGLVVEGETARRRLGVVFEPATDVETSAVREWVRAETPVGLDVPTRDVSLDREGRTVRLSWQQPLRSVTDRFATAAGRALGQHDWIDPGEATDETA